MRAATRSTPIDAISKTIRCFSTARKKTSAARIRKIIRAYLAVLSRRKLAAASVARRLSAVRQLHRFLYAEGRRKDDPAAVLEGPRRGRPLPKVLAVEEVTKLLVTAHERAEGGEVIEGRTSARDAVGVLTRSSLRDRIARLGADRFAGFLGAQQERGDHGAGKGRQGASRAPQPDRAPNDAAISFVARRGGRRGIALAVPLVRRQWPRYAPARCAGAENARCIGRASRRAR